LYADELEMTKSASFSTAFTSLSIKYRQAGGRTQFARKQRGNRISVSAAKRRFFLIHFAILIYIPFRL